MEDGERAVPAELNLVEEGDPSDPESDSRRLDVYVDEAGDLVMEGTDTGPAVERFFGDDDYEYWVTVPERYKDWLLLNVIKDRFAGERPDPNSAFKGWLEEKGIPYEFHAY